MRLLRTTMALAATLIVTATALIGSSPAQAAGRTLVVQGKCVFKNDQFLKAKKCSSSSAAKWTIVKMGTYNGHPLWQFVNQSNHKCITLSGVPGPITSDETCDSSHYRTWEVFYTGSGSNRRMVLKSFGAFKHQGKHLCMGYKSYSTITVANMWMFACNTSDKKQQFKP